MVQYYDEKTTDLIEKVIAVRRTSKVVKGGRRFSFSAIVVVGDGKGRVGLGCGKAKETSDAINKALSEGRRQLQPITMYRTTVPFAVIGRYKGARVLFKPATSGTGIIAGGAVRAVAEAAGIRDVLSKSLGSANHVNVAKAAIEALKSMVDKRTAFLRRGIQLKERADESPAASPATAPEQA